MPDLDELRRVFGELTDLHGWRSFQTPRNMTLALAARVGAVAEQLQFAADDDATPASPELRGEVADCLVYLVALADALGIDVVDEAVGRISTAVRESRAAGE